MNKQVHEGIAGSQAGFGLIQIAVSFLLVTTGLLGLVGSIVSSQLLARSAKEVNLANIAMVSAIEEFRFACATDFSGTCHDYIAGKALAAPSGLMAGVEMNARLINDEGEVTPPIDLDGNGVIGEIVNTISDLKVAVLEVEIQWPSESGQRQRLTYVTMIPRSEYEDTQVPPDPNVIPDSAKVDATAVISPTAVIGESCKIADGVVIQEYVTIESGTDIKSGTSVLSNASIGTNVKIGASTTIGGGTVIHDDAKIGDSVTIGDNVVIGVGATVPNGATIPGGTVIAAGTTYVQ